MADPSSNRVTQRRIAELAGVSQTTVSQVLNGATGDTARIAPATRARVEAVLESMGYVADPAARRLAGRGNNILGVFTYEPAFPHHSLDFYTGIEAAAERAGCDLLMFTGNAVVDGKRRIFTTTSRLSLADGCILMGRDMDHEELARLVAGSLPVVAIGRRDVPGLPSVSPDYATATRQLVRAALDAGHRDFAYLHLPGTAAMVRERQQAFLGAIAGTGANARLRPTDGTDLERQVQLVLTSGATILFVEDPWHAHVFYELATDAGVTIPDELSMVVLGEPSLRTRRAIDFTRLRLPRTDMGSRAVELLLRLIAAEPLSSDERSVVLECPIVHGSTLAAPFRVR